MTATTAFIVLCGALLVNGAFIRRPHLDGRISGGTDADIEDHPYQLSLRSNKYELCGATIISKYWVLTSARCAYNASTESMLFRAGSSLRSSSGSLHRAEEVIVHEKFDNCFDDYNYALVKVHPPFSFGPGVQAIGLAETEPATGEEAVITGWGLSASIGPYNERLQVANVPISDRETCADITPRMICTGPAVQDICFGDNGGPLVVGGNLVGIASYPACDNPEFASLYSSVANQRDWIKTKTGI